MVKVSEVTKGIIAYITNEMIPTTESNSLKILLSVVANMITNKQSIIENAIKSNSILTELLSYKDGNINIDALVSYLKSAMSKYGDFPVILPKIPFINIGIDELHFSEADVGLLYRHIIEEHNKNLTVVNTNEQTGIIKETSL